jgi:UDP-N-acetylglucosamine/UDP-N-acetylgalactosamine diphosphorylase
VSAEELRGQLAAAGQAHLLAGVEELDDTTRAAFLERLAAVPWEELGRAQAAPPLEEVEPPVVVTLAERERRLPELTAAGEREYARGAVGVLMVAGGQGTRLGFAGPKGLLPLAPHSGASIYEMQAQKVLSLSRRVGASVPLLVMTSPATDGETRAFFTEHGRFGLDEEQLRFLVQGMLPSLDADGRALLAGPGLLLESPDGHGGVLEALDRSGELGRLERDGVEHLVYIQVDNVLSRVDDAVLVGLAATERAEAVTKLLPKSDPDEKVGNLVTAAGRQRVVEYTELTPQEARRRGADGKLVYRWASPALHLWSVPFLRRLRERGFVPPVHRSAKPLEAWIDGAVGEVDGWKLERFVFDLLPEAERAVALEIERAAEFAPVKNASGADSPETAVRALHERNVAWLGEAGVDVSLPPGDLVEISPLLGATREQLLERWDGRVRELREGAYFE